MMTNERGHVPSTPEEIAAAWEDAERVTKLERPVMRWRALQLERWLRKR